jgi:HAD superfamily hydrolase (TIGR01549 family)
MTKILAIIFDFGQTLVDSAEGFRMAEKQAETKIFQDLGLGSWQKFLTEYRRLRREFHAKSNFSRKALWDTVYRHYAQEPNQQLISGEEDNYWQTVSSSTRLFPETKTALEQIALRYRLALITNTQGQQSSGEHRIRMFPALEKLFEVIIVAGEGDMPPKPDPKPFLTCVEILGIDPVNAIYIGDDWKIDVCGAQAVGMQPVWLKHHSISRNWPVIETTVPTITSLEQVLELDMITHSSWG